MPTAFSFAESPVSGLSQAENPAKQGDFVSGLIVQTFGTAIANSLHIICFGHMPEQWNELVLGRSDLSVLEKILAGLARVLIWLAALLLAAMAVHVTADVLMKYIFNKPIPGTAEVVARYYMLAVVFLPLPFAELRNSGISVDLIYNLFGRPVRRATMLFAYLGQTAFFGLLAYQSSLDAIGAFERGEYVDGQITVYTWPGYFFLPMGLWVVAAICVLRILQVLLRSDWEQVTGDKLPVEDNPHLKEMV